MSEDYDQRIHTYRTEIESLFKEKVSNIIADFDRMVEPIVEKYKQDLKALDVKGRILDDLVAVAKVSQTSVNIEDTEMWRKISDLLKQEGLL